MKKFLLTAGAFTALALAAASPANAVITTFAKIGADTQDDLYFKNGATNGKSSSATIYTISAPGKTKPGSVDVSFSFINEGATLDGAVDNVTALFTLNATTSSPAVNVAGYLIQPGISGTFSLVSTSKIVVGSTTYNAGSNLLSGTFGGAGLAGPNNSTSGSLDANNENGGATISYTSDFVSFVNGATLDAAFSLTSIQAALGDVDPGTYALKTFKTDAGGSFSADPKPTVNAAPEPATWAMMLVGVGGIGALARRRKAIVAA